MAGVCTARVVTLKSDHFSCFTGDCCLNSNLTDHEGFLNIHRRSNMRAAALQKTQLNATGLFDFKRILKIARKLSCQPTELCMAEPVRAGGLGLGNEAAVSIVNAFGYGDKDIVLLL